MNEVAKSCLEALFITIEQLADLFISDEWLSEAISIDHLRVWEHYLNQEGWKCLTDSSLVGSLTIPGDVGCDTD